MTTLEIKVPDIGDFSDVVVIELLVQVGDTIQLDQSLVTVESDKASMEIPSSTAGVVQELRVQLGDTINQGDVLLVLQVDQPTAPAATTIQTVTASQATKEPKTPSASTPVVPDVEAANNDALPVPTHTPERMPTTGLPHASPSVRKFARELGVPLAQVQGSGAKGRITHEDVQQFTRSVMQNQSNIPSKQQATGATSTHTSNLDLLPWPKVDFEKFGSVQRQPLARIKKISAANLQRNAVIIPHVTYCENADVTDLEALRVQLNAEKAQQQAGLKITMLSFLIKACVQALKQFPDFNASLDGDDLVHKQYYHIGFAADTPHGLMVPVIQDADQKGVLAISADLAELSKKARSGKLSPAEMQGATFTISSLGGIGGTYFSPIINAPEVAILGVCRSTMQPVWSGDAFEPRLMLPLSLSADHRVIDGAAAARFNAYVAQLLGDMRRTLL